MSELKTLRRRASLEPREHLSSRSLSFIGIPRKYQQYNLEDFEVNKSSKDIIRTLVNYVRNVHAMHKDSINLLFTGVNGGGKTMLLSILAKHAYANRYRTFLGTITEIMNLTFTPTHKLTEYESDRKQLLEGAEFILLDELGKENFTKSGSNIVLVENILRTAETKHSTVCIASNLSLEDIASNYGTSIFSLIDGNFVKLNFSMADYRKKKTLEKRAIELLKEEL